MKPAIRNVLAAVGGIVASGVVVALVEAINQFLYPPPANLDLTNPEALKSYIQGLPTGAFAIVLAAWCLGAFVGTVVGSGIAKGHPYRFATIIAAFLLLGVVVNLLAIAHPVWMAVVGLVSVPACAYLAARLMSVFFRRHGETVMGLSA